jgi:hypothetical protein
LSLGIALAEVDLEAEEPRAPDAGGLDIGQRLGAVDFRLAGSEQVQVRSVEDEDLGANLKPGVVP